MFMIMFPKVELFSMFIKYKATFLEAKVPIAIGNVNPANPGVNAIEKNRKDGSKYKQEIKIRDRIE